MWGCDAVPFGLRRGRLVTEEGSRIGHTHRIPARVLACLSRETITVILWPGMGLADGGIPIELPIAVVPPDLRMPNSEFDLIFDVRMGTYSTVVRKDESDSSQDEPLV